MFNWILLIFYLYYLKINLHWFFEAEKPPHKINVNNEQEKTFEIFTMIFILILFLLPEIITLWIIPDNIFKLFLIIDIVYKTIMGIKIITRAIIEDEILQGSRTPISLLQNCMENAMIIYIIYYISVFKLNLLSYFNV